ncbi:unnamed protein product [Coregonus sp. 'balchen']|nr:unnamed protein product [Coregonus sp. 'balchen']
MGACPPLNSHPHIPIPHIAGGANPCPSTCFPNPNPCVLGSSPSRRAVCGAVAGLRPLLHYAPSGLPRDLRTKRMLLRRHSMQTDQIKQLGDFNGIFGH